MDSTESERSLSGISLPQWMKSKIADRYDLDQSTFSPPTEDDSFFYIRYPKSNSVDPQSIKSSASTVDPPNYRSINEVLQNHTVPCQQFIPQAKTTPHELGLRKITDPPLGRIKSTGTDDGFKGEGAACGHSVVAVAHQMISGKLNSYRAYSDDENTAVDTVFNRSIMLRQRRNSKSLPASPRSSPKPLRRNPYFTNILFGSTDALENGNDSSGRSSWLSNILGVRDSQEDLYANVDEHHRFSDQEEPESPPLQPKVGQTFKAKPSELREMNFWSPTSM
ncbi:uncharacterized protein LOC142325584 isoform X2 [Lycorma delicatula]|uniref:uncharacterized protein LOC142325584 isoform X2 n=1 Tax=Lycorma delicatula TaxID=130591 RepID=UPI003F5130C9